MYNFYRVVAAVCAGITGACTTLAILAVVSPSPASLILFTVGGPAAAFFFMCSLMAAEAAEGYTTWHEPPWKIARRIERGETIKRK